MTLKNKPLAGDNIMTTSYMPKTDSGKADLLDHLAHTPYLFIKRYWRLATKTWQHSLQTPATFV
jgi:hypothetical protein